MAYASPETFSALVETVADHFGEKVLLRRRHGAGGDPVSFEELRRDVRRLARGLAARGIARGDRVAILAENSYAWLLCDLAVTYIGAVDVPRGVDTTPAELQTILAHSGCRLALCADERVARELWTLRDDLPALEAAVVMANESEVEDLATLADLMREGEDWGGDLDALVAAVEPTDLLSIVYTSGTTAEPKGVMLSHHNVLSNIFATNVVLGANRDDVFLSVLPAWHVYERIMDYLCLACGGELVYTTRRRIKEDLRKVQPTVFAAVPRIWETIHDGIVSHCEKLTGAKRRLMRRVLHNCREVGGERAGPLARLENRAYRATVLKKLTQVTGGNLRIAVSGGGALPSHVDEMMLGIGMPLLNGYGLTETSPVVCLRPPRDNRVGTIGPPIPDTRIEIRSPEGAALTTGEVGLLWVQGPQVMQGYYKNPERTANVLTADGWFNSGDLARFDARGHYSITGRAKDTIVLAGGENVEPEPVETGIKSSNFIEQAVVLGQDEKALGALVIPMLDCLEELVPRSEWGEQDGQLTGPKVLELIRAELDRLLTREAGFRPCERVARFKVITEPMTPENGLLTPTMKIKRHEVRRQKADLIAELFEKGG